MKKYLSLLICLVFVFGFGDRAVAEEGTFTLEQILSPPYPWSLVSAKNADRIAWVFYSKGERNVWTAAAPDFKPINLTGFVRDEVFEIPDVYITDDGKTVVFVKGGRPNSEGWVTNSRSDPDGMEQAIWAVRTDTGQIWRVAAGSNPTLSPDGQWILLVKEGLVYSAPLIPPAVPSAIPEPELLFRAAGQNGSPRWSPESTRIAFVSRRNDHSFIGVFDTIKRKITWIAPNVDRDSDPIWSSDGTKILFQRRPGLQYGAAPFRGYWRRGPVTNVAFWLADAQTGEAEEIWRFPKDEPRFYSFRNFKLTANDRILFTAERDNWNHVFSMPLAGGDPVDLTPGEAFVEHVGLSSDGETLFFSSNLTDIHGRHIWRVPTDGSGEAVQLTEEATIGTYPVALASGDKVAFLYATAFHPTSIATVPADGGEIEVLAPETLPAEYPMDELVIPELVIVKAPDGLEIPCQLFLPKDAKPGEKRPGVVYTHGGPIRQMLLGWHYMEFYSEAYGINQYFANNGYVVISINYRSGIGYGRSFRNAPDTGMRGAAEYQDILAGVKYLQERPEVDPERIGKWGLSYGGLLTAMALARNSDIFKVGVDMAGVHDWSQRGRSMSENQRKLARESSPVADIKTWTSPVLFIHGDDDRNVDFQQTTDIVQKLRAKGDVHIELMIVPDEPHEFMLFKNRMEAYNRTFEFIDRFIGEK
ncbi:MAG: S9 family peptidase [Candidatus Aminicenantes bacterium]|nr:MAG: S9 family peptidase [Candidatus Aminicenantes bacterium]